MRISTLGFPLFFIASLALAAPAFEYPAARRSSHVDNYFGTKVADPYRWMEDIDSPKTRAWVAAERALTARELAKIPERTAVRARLTALWNYPRFGLPRHEGGHYFFAKNDGLQNQSVVYVQDSLSAPVRVLIDPNTLSADGTVALGEIAASHDGKWLAYSLKKAGSDWEEFFVRDIATGKDTADHIQWVKFSGIAWTKDSKGFFYGRYPEVKKGDKLFGRLVNRRIYYHRIGTPQSADEKVFELPAHPDWDFDASVSDDGRYLLLAVTRDDITQNALYYLDLGDPQHPMLDQPVVKLLDAFDANYNYLHNTGDTFFVETTRDASRGKIVAIDLKAPDPAHWRTLVPESADNVDEAHFIGGRFVVAYMHDVQSRLAVFGADGKPEGDIALPGIGAVSGVRGRDDSPELFYGYSSFLSPPTVFRYDLDAGKGTVFAAAKVDFDASRYLTEQVWVTSKDGTRFPMFITRRKDFATDGRSAAWLYGYGGFDISILPQFSVPPLVWLEQGGIYVQATLRGGAELGESWHLAGTKEQKQHVFDDFIAAADWLVAHGYTRRDRLVVQGRSNGGLLIGAVINQRPDLAAVAIPQVGVMDMLRYQKFTIGAAWASDYGTSDTREGFKYLYAYSPLQNIKPGAHYPAVLVTTGDHDDRVFPAHSFKYAATLQAAVARSERPALIRIETNAGHGGSSGTTPVSKTIDEWTDMIGFALANIAPDARTAVIDYPSAKRDDVVDDYFGTKVPDPYRWLEDLDSPATRAWVAAENRLTFGFLEKLPQREVFKARLTKLWNYPKYGLPFKEGGHYFFAKNDGLQNQSVLYVQKTLQAEPRLLLDPNTLSKDGTIAVTAMAASRDGQWLAYGTAAAGSDWNEFHVRNIATGQDTPDVVKWVKFSGLAWTKDSRGFFYSRYDEPKEQAGTGKTFGDLEHQKVYYHRLGTPQSEDRLIAAIPDQPKWFVNADVTEDGRYAIIGVARGDSNNTLLWTIDLGDPAAPRLDAPIAKTIDDWTAENVPIGNDGPILFVQTNLDAPRKRIVAIDTRNPAPAHWRTVVPEGPDTIDSSGVVGGRIVVRSMHDVASRLTVYTFDGKRVGEIPLPGLGQVAGFTGRADEPDLFYNFTSFTYPTTIFHYNLATGTDAVFRAPTVDFNPADYETEQVFYPSKDGTRVPMFITHKKGLKLDGTAPTLLYAYGGFDISLQPAFSVTALTWMEAGGIYAVPNLRGGGEYGKAWHEAGTKERKQNVFDDYIAAAEWLFAHRYTSPAKLVLSGGSNGGLLVGATVDQRPDLCRVALPSVGVMDMLRFQKFTIGYAWVADYGSSDDPAGFKYLYAYSPLHNIHPGTKYPTIFVTTADHDDRVYPAHSFKYTAAMQAAVEDTPDAGPVLIRIETRAGHGLGKPTAKIIEETADKLAFAAHFVGMEPK